jgi:uncharacterized protein (DUF2141 family)
VRSRAPAAFGVLALLLVAARAPARAGEHVEGSGLPEVPASARSPSTPQSESPTSITVRVEGVEGTRGLLRISLFEAAEGFPERSELAARTASLEPVGATAEVVFDDVAAGGWAVAVLHDENGNGRLDRNFLGIPKEGVGASNDAVRFGLPKFEDARLQVSVDGATIVVKLKYWL